MSRYFVDLHCHTNASFDSLSSPRKVVEAAATRGLTHLAVTDHDRIEGALRARVCEMIDIWLMKKGTSMATNAPTHSARSDVVTIIA